MPPKPEDKKGRWPSFLREQHERRIRSTRQMVVVRLLFAGEIRRLYYRPVNARVVPRFRWRATGSIDRIQADQDDSRKVREASREGQPSGQGCVTRGTDIQGPLKLPAVFAHIRCRFMDRRFERFAFRRRSTGQRLFDCHEHQSILASQFRMSPVSINIK